MSNKSIADIIYYARAVVQLRAALEPFVLRSASEEYVYVKLATENIRVARRALNDTLDLIPPEPATGSTQDKEITQLVDERDVAEHYADKLATALFRLLDIEPVEHSSASNPWLVALNAYEEHSATSRKLPPGKESLLKDLYSVASNLSYNNGKGEAIAKTELYRIVSELGGVSELAAVKQTIKVEDSND